MPKGWQHPTGTLHRSESGACWWFWRAPDECEVREVRYGNSEHCDQYLAANRDWYPITEAYMEIPASWVLDARGALNIGVEPLEPGRHITDPMRDACLACGQYGSDPYGPCAGWRG